VSSSERRNPKPESPCARAAYFVRHRPLLWQQLADFKRVRTSSTPGLWTVKFTVRAETFSFALVRPETNQSQRCADAPTPVQPSKIIAVGLNYADHAQESGKPLPQRTAHLVQGSDFAYIGRWKDRSAVRCHRTDYEAELCYRPIGRRVRNVTPAAGERYYLRLHRLHGYQRSQHSKTMKANGRGPNRSIRLHPLGPYVDTKLDPHG
jgi:hypothetical protein